MTTTHTCNYALELLVRTTTVDLAPENDLFVYSTVFPNVYFGEC